MSNYHIATCSFITVFQNEVAGFQKFQKETCQILLQVTG